MNREIKFRVWDKQAKKMFNVNAIDFKNREFLELEDIETLSVVVVPKGKFPEHYELIEYTGLKDKNGKEIYEGDIYKDAKGIISIVDMACEGWGLFPIKKDSPVRNLYWHNVCDETKGEVVANIFDNSELLEQNQ